MTTQRQWRQHCYIMSRVMTVSNRQTHTTGASNSPEFKSVSARVSGVRLYLRTCDAESELQSVVFNEFTDV